MCSISNKNTHKQQEANKTKQKEKNKYTFLLLICIFYILFFIKKSGIMTRSVPYYTRNVVLMSEQTLFFSVMG